MTLWAHIGALSGPTYCHWVLQTLRSRRYLGLIGVSVVIALVCVGAGSWQIARFDWKRNANHHLRSDDHATVTQITQTLGPAESFKIRWREEDPGTWLYHCHVESHMMAGMIGLYHVTR